MIQCEDKTEGKIFLLTGLSGSGKTTLGRSLETMLEKEGKNVFLLDGDYVRKFFGTTGGSEEERFEQGKRLAFGAHLLSNNGIDIIMCVVLGQEYLREYMGSKINFKEIFLDVNIEDCIKNDPKGFYAKYSKLEKPNIRGIDLPFEKPKNPDLVLYPYKEDLQQSLEKIKYFLKQIGYLK